MKKAESRNRTLRIVGNGSYMVTLDKGELDRRGFKEGDPVDVTIKLIEEKNE